MKLMKLSLNAILVLLFFISACSELDNKEYKPLDTEKMTCRLIGVKTRKEQFDQGVMTPIDGKFVKMVCGIAGPGGRLQHKELATIENNITDGVIKTVNYGAVHITFHGPSSSGLYDGTVAQSGYYDPGMRQRFYMTDFQAHKILKFLKDKSKKVDPPKRAEGSGNASGGHISGNKDSDIPSAPAEAADIGLIQNIINCVVKAEAENKKSPIPNLPEDASLAVYFIRTFGYKPGDPIDKAVLNAFLKAQDFTQKCIQEKWVDEKMMITRPDEVSQHFNQLFSGTELKAFDKIKSSNLKQAPSSSEGGSGNKLIDAARIGNLEQVNVLIENGADVNATVQTGTTALMVAAAGGYDEIVTMLLDKGADVHAKLENGVTPLIIASQNGRAGIVKALLSKGADANAQRENGKTALMETVQRGHLEIAQSLLDNGADVNAKEKHGVTALIIASLNGYQEITRLLIAKGADVNAKFEGDWTALKVAEKLKKQEIARILRDAGAANSR